MQIYETQVEVMTQIVKTTPVARLAVKYPMYGCRASRPIECRSRLARRIDRKRGEWMSKHRQDFEIECCSSLTTPNVKIRGERYPLETGVQVT